MYSLNILLVCRTCDRAKPIPPGDRSDGSRLAQSLSQCIEEQRVPSIIIRSVECLSGCPQPCNVALKTYGKTHIQVSHVTERDSSALIDLAVRYHKSSDGTLPAEEIPCSLRSKIKCWKRESRHDPA